MKFQRVTLEVIFEPAPVTGLAQLGVRNDEPMPQATPQVPSSPQRSDTSESEPVTRMPRSVKRRTEEHSPSYTPVAGNGQAQAASANNGDDITPNVGTNNVDATKNDSGNGRMMSALQRFAEDIGIRGSPHNLTRVELMDLVYTRFDKIDAEQSRKAAREAIKIDKQVPARNDNPGNSASGGNNATKSVTSKRSAPGPALVSVPRPEPTIPRFPASKPIEEARRVPLPGSPKAPGNPEKKTVAGSSAMPMARVRSLRDLLNLPGDTGRPV